MFTGNVGVVQESLARNDVLIAVRVLEPAAVDADQHVAAVDVQG